MKVADFTLTEVVYTKGYFFQEKDASVQLLYKWMPPESLQDLVSLRRAIWLHWNLLCKVSVKPSAKIGLLPEMAAFTKVHHAV